MFAEKHYSVQELAQRWALSTDTVRRLFEGEHGIIIIARLRNRTRVYRTFRIPHTVAERVYRRLQQNGGV